MPIPRPFPWLARLPNIRRAVWNSQRSHYGRRDLELLFAVSPRAAVRLLELIATERLGAAHLVARERLSGFLEAVSEAKDVAGLVAQIRHRRENLSRAKSRFMWFRDDSEVSLGSLPAGVSLDPGRLEVRFRTVEELVAHLGAIAAAMQDDPAAFEQRCEPRRAEESPDAAFLRRAEAEKVWIEQEMELRRNPGYRPRSMEDFEREWERRKPPAGITKAGGEEAALA